MRFHIAFFLILLSFTYCSAQLNQGFINSFGSSGFSEDSEYIAMDSEGNIWMAGEFDATWSPPSGPGFRSFSTKGLRDIYVVKMNPQGETLWCGTLQNSYDSWMTGIDVDSEDNVIITGAFRSTVDFNPSSTEVFNIGAGVSNWHGFLLKLDTNGDFQWARKFGTTGNSWHVYARDIVIDEDDNFIIAGTFSNPMAYGSLEFSSAGRSIFVIKADKNGIPIWGERIADSQIDSRGNVLAIDKGGSIILRGNTSIYRINANNGSVGILSSNNVGTSIATDETGVYSLHLRNRTEEFVGRSTLTKYIDSGLPQWINNYDEAVFYEFNVTPFGLFAYGVVNNGINVMPSGQEVQMFDGPEPKAGIIQKIDPYTGTVIKNTFFPTDITMGFYGMVFNEDKVVMCGTYHGATALDFEDPSHIRNGGNFGTSFVMEWTDCESALEANTQWTCKPIDINGQDVSVSGLYYETTADEYGCILTQSIELEVELFDKTILSDGEELYVSEQPYDIQWFDCLSGDEVSGANDFTFMPNDDRLYGVILENDGCRDTSACVSVKDYSFDAQDLKEDSEFGHNISVSGDWTAIATKNSNKNSSGYVYLFKREGNRWVEKQKIGPNERSAGDRFGDAIDLYEDRLAIGAWNDDTVERDAGKVYLYRLNNGTWEFEQAVYGSDIDLNDRFGNSVAISDGFLLVGAVGKNSNGNNSIQSKEGAAYAFRTTDGRSGSNWQEVQKLTNSIINSRDNFGRKVRIEGDLAFISAPYAQNRFTSSIGKIQSYFINSDRTLTSSVSLTYAGDEGLGYDFDVSGERLITVTDSKVLYFEKPSNNWIFREELEEESTYLARVSIDGDYAAYITSPFRGNGRDVNLLYFDNGSWELNRNFENAGDINTHVSAFDMNSNYILMGAPDNSQSHEYGGRVFTHFYGTGSTPTLDFDLEQIKFSPNPVNDILQLEVDEEISAIVIIDLFGHTWNICPGKSIDVSFLESGVYFLYLEGKQGKRTSGKFVKL